MERQGGAGVSHQVLPVIHRQRGELMFINEENGKNLA